MEGGAPMQTTKQFAIDASWLRACGMVHEYGPLVVPVLTEFGPRHCRTADVLMPDGSRWTVVTNWRGRFI